MHNMITAARGDGLAFFDRGIVDQVSGFEPPKRPMPPHLERAAQRFRYHRRVFFLPPWPQIYRTDAERRHSFEEALASYEPLRRAYERFGYEVVEVPKLDTAARADFVLADLKALVEE
jgi:predicted ATPase